jgi:hypothetical protein
MNISLISCAIILSAPFTNYCIEKLCYFDLIFSILFIIFASSYQLRKTKIKAEKLIEVGFYV